MKEKTEFFYNRTEKHIKLFKSFCSEIVKHQSLRSKIDKHLFYVEMKAHDQSKYEEPEFSPYVHTTWKHKCQEDGYNYNPPADIEEQMFKATIHHITTNKHHPEYWTKFKGDLLNDNDRDKPTKEVIDCKNMPLTYVASMVADWMAVSKERKTDPFKWANDNINVRWGFSTKQEDFIYKILNTVWGK